MNMKSKKKVVGELNSHIPPVTLYMKKFDYFLVIGKVKYTSTHYINKKTLISSNLNLMSTVFATTYDTKLSH